MELTFDNVYNLLESTKYTTDYMINNNDAVTFSQRSKDYYDIIKLLLDNFYPEYVINENIQAYKNYSVGMVLAPYPSYIFKDVTILTINNFYSTTIALLNTPKIELNDNDPFREEEWDNDLFNQQLRWNIEEFPKLYNFLLENYKNFKERSTDKKVSTIVNFIINITYGIAIGGSQPIKCGNSELIIKTLSKITNEIRTKFINYYTYIDTDMFFFTNFEEISDDICKMLDDWGYTYEIKKVNYFLSIDKKKYLTSDNPFDAHGFKDFSNNEKQRIMWNEKRNKLHEKIERNRNSFFLKIK
jgi:hypothetical protein